MKMQAAVLNSTDGKLDIEEVEIGDAGAGMSTGSAPASNICVKAIT